MMDNFEQILQRLPTGGASSSNSHLGGSIPFKVQVNFDIPIFEGQIDADTVDKWLNLLERYFYVHGFSSQEKITFALLKATPTSRTCGKTIVSRRMKVQPHFFQSHPLRIHSGMPLSSRNTLSGAMRIST